jgi:hypothetical protein
MIKEIDYVMLSDLIKELQLIEKDTGDKFVGFEDDDSYTTKCKLKITENGDLIFDLSK